MISYEWRLLRAICASRSSACMSQGAWGRTCPVSVSPVCLRSCRWRSGRPTFRRARLHAFCNTPGVSGTPVVPVKTRASGSAAVGNSTPYRSIAVASARPSPTGSSRCADVRRWPRFNTARLKARLEAAFVDRREVIRSSVSSHRLMTIDSGCFRVRALASVTATVNEERPAVDGFPERWPDPLRCSPAGRCPDVSRHA
jgi:hypothetical protein